MKTIILLALVFTTCLLMAGCSDETTIRSDTPASRVAASRDLGDFPFPRSSHSIYYIFYVGGMQDLEEYVRFDVDPGSLDSATDALVSWNNKQTGWSLPYPREPLSSATPITPRKIFLPMPWWNPTTIVKGYFRGHNKSHALQIFADETNSRIYVYRND